MEKKKVMKYALGIVILLFCIPLMATAITKKDMERGLLESKIRLESEIVLAKERYTVLADEKRQYMEYCEITRGAEGEMKSLNAANNHRREQLRIIDRKLDHLTKAQG